MKKVICKVESNEVTEEIVASFELLANTAYQCFEIELRAESNEVIANFDCPHTDEVKANLLDLFNQAKAQV